MSVVITFALCVTAMVAAVFCEDLFESDEDAYELDTLVSDSSTETETEAWTQVADAEYLDGLQSIVDHIPLRGVGSGTGAVPRE